MRGSTRKRGTTWTAYWDSTTETGDRKQKSKGGFQRQKDAEAFLDDVLVQVRGGTYQEPSKQTLLEFMRDEWLPAISGTVKRGTAYTYGALIRQYIEQSELGQIPLMNVGPRAHQQAVRAA